MNFQVKKGADSAFAFFLLKPTNLNAKKMTESQINVIRLRKLFPLYSVIRSYANLIEKVLFFFGSAGGLGMIKTLFGAIYFGTYIVLKSRRNMRKKLLLGLCEGGGIGLSEKAITEMLPVWN